uniref:Large ribosomal subunit protein uL23 n=1 Tax=uncultured Chloroflexi bacterium Rifle_16ft_4_minimus_29343 TaxID=1665066 RepID=A0A0H4TER8_9CHLR|nr:50S ribosomal protein L25, large subunit ribosomal protein L23 [uncultured Chloroflexi bacterium Rifle_16ft_4_minimus_29343]
MELAAYEILKRPIVTEKSTRLQDGNQYVFEVDRKANKPQIKSAVEQAFSVKVASVNVMQMPGKARRAGRRLVRPRPWKKAVVTLREGSITFFEGM